jgi:hypothetical protein
MWFIYRSGDGQFSLAKENPGFGWMQHSGPYATFAEGGAAMKALGVPGWEAY